jgi:tRNA A58 N-methylase Trm61
MVELTRLDSATVVRACDFSGVERIVDVAGGYGELLAAMLQAHPAAGGVLFDRLHAIQNGRLHMEAAGVADRCEFVAGNFFESIPSGADVYVLKSVIHDWNDEWSKVILQNCRRAMHERAKLLLVERIVPLRLQASAAHKAIARSDLNMLVGLGGQERTEDEYRTLLGATGFRVKAVVRAGPTFSIIEATPLG